jgi:thymidylate kinase
MKQSLFVVEIVGPAGAGKSTLTKALSECDANIQVGVYPYTRDVRNLPFFLYNAMPLLPMFISFYRDRRHQKLTRSQQAVMTILQGWPRLLRQMSHGNRDIVILDQGPVYMLSDLLRSGPSNLREIAPFWWHRTCQEWGNLLSAVISLDAPDTLLLERVRHREKYHGFKRDTDQQAIRFLDRCRQTQAETLSSLNANSTGLTVVCFDTSQSSLPDVAQSTLTLFRHYMDNKTS